MKQRQSRQISLFDTELKAPPVIKEDPEKVAPCCLCGVMPVFRERTVEGKEYRLAKCPECGYQCGTHYPIIPHWNTCNKHRAERIESGKAFRWEYGKKYNANI